MISKKLTFLPQLGSDCVSEHPQFSLSLTLSVLISQDDDVLDEASTSSLRPFAAHHRHQVVSSRSFRGGMDVLRTPSATVHFVKEQRRMRIKAESAKLKREMNRLRAKRFTVSKWLFEVWRMKHLYLAVLLHLIDTTTDFAVMVMVMEGAWSERQYNLGDKSAFQVKHMNAPVIFLCIFVLLIGYRGVSAIAIWTRNRTNHHSNPWRRSKALLQLLDLTIFWELYDSHFIGTKTEHFLLISKMKVFLFC